MTTCDPLRASEPISPGRDIDSRSPAPSSERRAMIRRLRRYMLICVLSVAGACAAYLAGLQITGNFHEVIPNEFYRSAQPSTTQLRGYVRKYGIKTIINLRGPSDQQWHRDEVETAKALGVAHLDYRMSSGRRLSLEEMADVATLMRNAQKPLLVHCTHGADRSSLVSAIYLKEVAQRSDEEAGKQISFRFGHVAAPYLSRTYAMDESWEALEAAGAAGLTLGKR